MKTKKIIYETGKKIQPGCEGPVALRVSEQIETYDARGNIREAPQVKERMVYCIEAVHDAPEDFHHVPTTAVFNANKTSIDSVVKKAIGWDKNRARWDREMI